MSIIIVPADKKNCQNCRSLKCVGGVIWGLDGDGRDVGVPCECTHHVSYRILNGEIGQ